MENEQKKKTPMWQRILILALGVCLILAGAVGIAQHYLEINEKGESGEALWFDLYSPSEDLQMLEFLFISEPFAEYSYGSSQGFYLVYDEDMYGYIVCMNNDRLEEEFRANYDYTYEDIERVPALGYVEGYSVEIDEELKEYALDFCNDFWGEEFLDETNFSDYLGNYYLDTTLEPASEGSISTQVVMIVVGLIFVVIAITKAADVPLQKTEQEERTNQDNPYMNDTETVSYSGSPEVEKPGSLLLALIGSVIGACVGGVLWVLIYKLGYIAGITGCVAAVGALTGFRLLGKRETTGGVVVWCVFISLVVLLLGNAVAYAWDFTEAFNEGSPGRAEFFTVLKQLPTVLKEYDCVGSFFGDWVMGVFFAALSGFSLGGRKKK